MARRLTPVVRISAALLCGTLESAPRMAQSAQASGQEDDITVLTLTFSAAPSLAEAIHA